MNLKLRFQFLIVSFCLLIGNSLMAQVGTPTYMNHTGTGGAANAFPFNGASNKVQWVFAPGAFSTGGSGTGTPAPGGNLITKIYIRFSGTINGTNTIPNIKISMGQNVGTISNYGTTTTSGVAFNTGLTTVFFQASGFTFSGITANSWYGITLQTPFAYDPTLALIVEGTTSATSTGCSVQNVATAGSMQRLYAAAAATTGTINTGLTPIGFDMIPSTGCTAPPTAGTNVITPNTNVCSSQQITLGLTGNSTGSGQTYTWQSSTTAGGTYTAISSALTSPSFNYNPTADLYYRCAVTCSTSTATTTPTQLVLQGPLAGGTYTINSALATSGSNFQTFTDAINALKCGIAGPVVLNVNATSGPYNEQVVIPNLAGSSAVNTLTINGNGRTLTSAGVATGNYATLAFDGADYVRVNNLIVENTGATNGFGIHLSNGSNNNIFTNVTVNVSTTATGSTSGAVCMSGSRTSYSTSGVNGTNNEFRYCNTTGGYFGFSFYGDGSSYLNNAGNSIKYCNIRDYYFYGIYNYYQGNNSIYKNILERPTRTSVSTGYGIVFTTGCVNAVAERNHVRNLWGGVVGSTSISYPLYCSSTSASAGNENKFINNIVSDINSNGTQYGIYLTTATYVQSYFNTIVLNDATSTAGATYGFYSTSTGAGIDVRNNIFHIERAGTGTKYCIYLASATAVSENNNLYMNSPAGTNAVGFYSVAYTTLLNWETANGSAWDQLSVATDPLYTNPIAYNYKPNSPAMNNKGVTIAGVSFDYDSVARPATPDIGAYEYSAAGTNGSLVWNSPTGAQTTGNKTIKVDLTNTLTTTITSANVTYTNGVASVTQNFTGLNITSGNTATLTFTTPFNLTTTTNFRAYINNVNGITDFTQTDDTTNWETVCIMLSGTNYTINSALATGGTNFQTFQDAINALSCGIASPKVISVVAGSGPYNEQVDFTTIPGTSSVNTITINGNGNLLTNAGITGNYVTLNMNGADYIRINNLRVESTGATNAIAVHITNDATNNIFSNCHFSVPLANTSTTNSALAFSGTNISPTASGTNGSNNTFNTDTMSGGYYCVSLYGNTTNTALNSNNTLNNCLVREYYIYGIYSAYQTNGTIKNCIVERPTRATVSTGYGIVLTTGAANWLVEKNMVRNLFGGAPTSASTCYGLYCSSTAASLGQENKFYNNIVTDIKTTGTIYGMYLTTGTFVTFYHNTINLDDATSASGAAYGIYSTSTAASPGLTFRNNLINITKGGTGVKYAIYLASSGVVSNYNDLFVDTSGASNNVGFYGSAFKSLANWKAANGGAWDQNSQFVAPAFSNPSTYNLKPTASLLDDMGTNVGITTDFTGASRSATTPDIGAYEFSTNGANGAVTWVSPTGPQTAGNKTITFKITNTSLTFAIDSFNVTYTDGTTSVTQNFTGVGLAANTNQNFSFTTPYNLTASTNLRVYINSINGTSDLNQGDDTTGWNYLCLALGGTNYTINSTLPTSGTNFNSFADAITAFSCGITSPKVINVVAGTGPYNEQIDLGSIPGASAVNTITINGNGNTLTSAGSGTNYATLNLNGTRYVTVNNLNIENTGATSAFGVHLMGDAEFNTFSNCNINVSTSATGTTCVGVSISGSKTSYSTSGNNASNNTFTGCTITGGYFAAAFYGNSADVTQNSGNALIGCTLKEFYVYGSYNAYQSNNIIRGNTIERPTRTSTTTTYGVMLTTGSTNYLVEKNKIRNLFGAITASTVACYPIYVSSTTGSVGNENKIYNNVITDINTNGTIYGIYALTSTYLKVYHNTINLDDATSTAGTTYGIYSTATTPTGLDVKNNMITISRGGNGTKYCLYYSGAVASSNYNDLYITSTTGINAVGYFGAAFTTLANWKTANGGAWDQNSISENPIYTNVSTHNLAPTSYFTDNKGTNVGITQDVNNVTRATVPDVGAYEYDYILPAVSIPYRINSIVLDSFNTNGGTPSGAASCAGGNPDDDKFFSVIKPAGYTAMNIVLEGSSNFNGVFEVFTGTNPTNFVLLGCVNPSSATLNQKETRLFTGLSTAAVTYYIRVYDFRTGAGSGAFKLGVYYMKNATTNNVPCLAINASNNTAKIAGYPYQTTAYDNGVLGGTITDTSLTPPVGPNIAYWTGSTAFAPYIAGAPLPSCGTPSAAPRRVWYAFNIPGMSDVDVVLRTGYSGTSSNTIIEAMTATVIPCPTVFNVVKCSNTGTLRLTAADLAPYIGQKMYIQLTEDGGTANGMDYMLSIQAVAPTISASGITTNSATINLPTGVTNLTKYRVYYRLQGSTGYTFFDVPSTATTTTLNNLVSGATYHVWVGYYNSINTAQIYLSERINFNTVAGCSGSLPAPTAAIAPAPNTSCTKALITWPAFANAGTAYKYRFYYRLATSTGYSSLALNDTFITLTGLTLNANYEFFYKAVCTSGTVLSGVATMYANCGTPKTGQEVKGSGIVTINGVTYNNVDFRELVEATEGNTIPDGKFHDVTLGDKSTANNLAVYPNPANEFVNVEFETEVGSDTKLQLIGVDGRISRETFIDTKSGVINPITNKLMIKERIDLTQINEGVHLVRIIENGVETTKQVLIMK